MQNLVKNICGTTGLSDEKAVEVLQTISVFIKEKYPLLSGTVDMVLESNITDNENLLKQ
jgi:hypothetical protein